MKDSVQHTAHKRGETQKRILDFISVQIQEKGFPPSVREICDAIGLKSTSTVHGHLRRLEKQGLLKRDSMKPRAMALLNTKNKNIEDAIVTIPLLGPVAAGSPILAEESIGDELTLPAFVVGEGQHFALLIRGESMIKAGIMDGDYVIVKKQSDANNGDIIVAMINGDATVKRFYRERGTFRLQPENDAMQPIYTTSVEVLGKVVSLYRCI